MLSRDDSSTDSAEESSLSTSTSDSRSAGLNSDTGYSRLGQLDTKNLNGLELVYPEDLEDFEHQIHNEGGPMANDVEGRIAPIDSLRPEHAAQTNALPAVVLSEVTHGAGETNSVHAHGLVPTFAHTVRSYNMEIYYTYIVPWTANTESKRSGGHTTDTGCHW